MWVYNDIIGKAKEGNNNLIRTKSKNSQCFQDPLGCKTGSEDVNV